MNRVVAYQAAFRELQEAEKDLLSLTYTLRNFAQNAERHPEETCFTRIDGEPEPPLEDLLPGKRWNPDTFPSPEILQAAIRRRYEARIALYELWRMMPDDQKIGLAPPAMSSSPQRS